MGGDALRPRPAQGLNRRRPRPDDRHGRLARAERNAALDFRLAYLWDGVPLIPATLGLFALPELAELAVSRRRIAGDNAANIDLSSQWEGVRDVGRNWWLVLRCSVLGTGLGAIPGSARR